MKVRYEYAVRYRRAGWKSRQAHHFQSWQAARKFRAKLYAGSSRWAPIVDLVVERREVGPWVEVDQWVQR